MGGASRLFAVSIYGPSYFIERLNDATIIGEPEGAIARQRWQVALEAAENAHRPTPILEEIPTLRSALLVIDMQRAFLDVGASVEVPAGRSIVANINALSSGVRHRGGHVVFFRYLVERDAGLLTHFERESYIGRDRVSPLVAMQRDHHQFGLYPELTIVPDDLVMDKIRYSAVIGSDIVDRLRQWEVTAVIITGVTTDVCAGNTAEDLMQKDFNVVVAWDGTAALSRLEHELYLARIFGLYGDVMPTEEILRRLK